MKNLAIFVIKGKDIPKVKEPIKKVKPAKENKWKNQI